jgi:signal transduction histidine kinase
MNVFDFDHLQVYVMAVLLISVFVLIFYNRLFVYREHQMESQDSSQNARLRLVLLSGKLHIWSYVVSARHYIRLSETGDYTDEYNPLEFSQFFDRDDYELFRTAIFDICEGRRETASFIAHSSTKVNGMASIYDISISVAERNAKGEVERLIGIEHDITEDVKKEQHVNQLLLRFHTVFNSSLSDMLYYDKDGVLRDINDTACQTFKLGPRQEVLEKKFELKDNPMFPQIDIRQANSFRTTSILDFGQLNAQDYHLEGSGLNGKLYYELSANPVYDAAGELEGVYISGRDVTDMVESFHHQQEGMAQLKKATKSIQDYVRSINYALRVSGVRLVNYYAKSYTLEVSDNVSETQLRMSQLRCIRLATPRFRRNVSSALNRMDHLINKPIQEAIETEIRDQKGRQIWLLFNMIPMLDSEGRVERYFGMCRNQTEMVETERRLAVETRKAQETELLKQSFLTNMSYEIRTPLNTVVGFAELFEGEHDEADEPVFVEEIKRNSNQLLQLINDILFLSRLDAKMIEFKKQDVDFAILFDAHCQMGWSLHESNVSVSVENPYERLIVNIDAENLGKVIENICKLASLYTKEGSIRAKYEYWRGELQINVEDTGVGIDPETLPKVFERFVRNCNEELCGTGLDLPIVQSLVQQMGGTIELQSELGKGSSVWVTIPCEAKTIEKKVMNASSSSSSLFTEQLFL